LSRGLVRRFDGGRLLLSATREEASRGERRQGRNRAVEILRRGKGVHVSESTCSTNPSQHIELALADLGVMPMAVANSEDITRA